MRWDASVGFFSISLASSPQDGIWYTCRRANALLSCEGRPLGRGGTADARRLVEGDDPSGHALVAALHEPWRFLTQDDQAEKA
jgi:hypothetical protein